MTETNQHASGQGDARKGQTSVTKRSGFLGVLGCVACVLFYSALIVAVGFSAFQLPIVAKGIQVTSAKQEANARKSADMSTKMDHIVLQIRVLRSVVHGLESSIGVAWRKLEEASTQMKSNQLEKGRVEEALQTLHRDLPKDPAVPSTDDITEKAESLLTQHTTAEEVLKVQRQAVQEAITGFELEMGAVRSSLGQLQSNMAVLGGDGTKISLRDLSQRVKEVVERLSVLEGKSEF